MTTGGEAYGGQGWGPEEDPYAGQPGEPTPSPPYGGYDPLTDPLTDPLPDALPGGDGGEYGPYGGQYDGQYDPYAAYGPEAAYGTPQQPYDPAAPVWQEPAWNGAYPQDPAAWGNAIDPDGGGGPVPGPPAPADGADASAEPAAWGGAYPPPEGGGEPAAWGTTDGSAPPAPPGGGRAARRRAAAAAAGPPADAGGEPAAWDGAAEADAWGGAAGADGGGGSAPGPPADLPQTHGDGLPVTEAQPHVPTPPPPPGGRAARRRAAAAGAAEAEADGWNDTAEPSPPSTGGRAARRRAARAAEAGDGQGDAAGRDAPATGGRAARRLAAAAAGAGETGAPLGGGGGRAARRRAAAAGTDDDPETVGLRRPAASGGGEPPPGAGRAARRKAAKAAAKAARQTGTALSNVIGELFITTGVLLLLFVVYQLWWTNYEAKANANRVRDDLQEQWDGGGGNGGDGNGGGDGPVAPGAFDPGEGFAILYLPTLDVDVPIAETTDEGAVLDEGLVGHYTEEDGLPTAMPWDDEGNVGLAGHRNTHGEPFRHINQLEPGDPIVIETEDAFYTYEMTSRLDQTDPSNTDVLDPIPTQGGFSEPGRYITLTTCTPEFTSTYRLIVWGQMVEERPREEGLPDALSN